MKETFTFGFTYEATLPDSMNRPCVVASYDCEALCEVIDDGEDWSIKRLTVEGIRHEGQSFTPGHKRVVAQIVIGPQFPLHAAMLDEAEKRATDEINDAISEEKIGSVARKNAQADYAYERYREDHFGVVT